MPVPHRSSWLKDFIIRPAHTWAVTVCLLFFHPFIVPTSFPVLPTYAGPLNCAELGSVCVDRRVTKLSDAQHPHLQIIESSCTFTSHTRATRPVPVPVLATDATWAQDISLPSPDSSIRRLRVIQISSSRLGSLFPRRRAEGASVTVRHSQSNPEKHHSTTGAVSRHGVV